MPSLNADIFSEASFSHGKRSRRFVERAETSLWVEVRGHDAVDHQWIETGNLIDASRSGARLVIAHRVEMCQLLHLTAPMPSEMRCFDETEKEYKIWALVRSVTLLRMVDGQTPQHEIGVAFVGKTAPASYKSNPAALYEPLPAPNRNGLWTIREKPRVKDSQGLP